MEDMNLNQILMELGLQDRAALLRSKNVTSSTFSAMDGSAKQIIHMGERLGLPAEEIVKIKAAIEEKLPLRVEAASSLDSQAAQGYRGYGQSGPGYFASRQVPHARAQDNKTMQQRGMAGGPGQMAFAQKGGPMKTEKVILDYGRKNRLSKLVSGGQALAQPSQHLSRKGTQQASMNMGQFLSQNAAHAKQNSRSGERMPQQVNPQKSTQRMPMYQSNQPSSIPDNEPQRHGGKVRSPQIAYQQPHPANKTPIESGPPSTDAMLQRPSQINRQSSANSDQRQHHGPNKHAVPQQQIQPTPFVATTVPSQQLNQRLPQHSVEQQVRLERQLPGGARSNRQEAPSTEDHHLNGHEEEDFEEEDDQVHQDHREAINKQGAPVADFDAPDPVYQDLGNRQSQEYLSEKLGKLCSQQDETNPRKSQPSYKYGQQQQQYSETGDEDEFTPNDNLTNLDLDESKTHTHCGNQPSASDQQQVRPVDIQAAYQNPAYNKPQPTAAAYIQQPLNAEAALIGGHRQMEGTGIDAHAEKADKYIGQEQYQEFQEEQSPSAAMSESDLEDPDARDGEDRDENGAEDLDHQFAGNEIQNFGEVGQDHQQDYEQSDEGAQLAEEESNSRLSDQQQTVRPPVSHQSLPQVEQAPRPPQSQQQHHSRPTIGMKQPAQHSLHQVTMRDNVEEPGTIPSGSSSPPGTATGPNQYQQTKHADFGQAVESRQAPAYGAESDSDDEEEDEESDREFLDQETNRQVIRGGQLGGRVVDNNHNMHLNQNQEETERSDQQAGDDDEEEDEEDKSIENLEDEEMPDDADYQQRVSHLRKERELQAEHKRDDGAPNVHSRTAQEQQHLWGVRQQSQAMDNFQQLLQSQPTHHSQSNQNLDQQQRFVHQSQNSHYNEHEKQKAIVHQQQSQTSHHQLSQQQSHSQGQINQMAYRNEEQMINNMNNQCSHSSQNTFLDVAGGNETAQGSKHSSHSMHRQQLQNNSSQQASQKHNQQAQGAGAIMSQNSGNVQARQERQGNQSAVNANACTVSQPSSYQSNNREPHHLLIENDERSTAINLHPQFQQHVQAAAHPSLGQSTAQAAAAQRNGGQTQANDQEMFEQLHGQLKLQSNHSNFNINLTQVQPVHNSNSSAEVNNQAQLHSSSSLNKKPPALGQQHSGNNADACSKASPTQYLHSDREHHSQQNEQQMKRTSRRNSQNGGSSMIQNFAPSPQTSMVQANSQQRAAPVQQPSTAGLRASPFNHTGSGRAASPSAASPAPLKVNKETPAQADLLSGVLEAARKDEAATTTATVTENVTQQVREQVTTEVTARVTNDVSARVRAETHHELHSKHQGELQQVQNHYEQKMRERVAMERHQLEKEKMERVDQLEQRLNEAKRELQAKQEDFENAKRQLMQRESALQGLQGEHQKKEQELQSLRAEQGQHQASFQRLQDECATAMSDKRQLQDQVNNQSIQVEQSNEKINELENQLVEQRDLTQKERSKQLETEQQLMRAQASVSETERQISDLDRQLREVKEELHQNNQQNEEMRKQHEQRLQAETEKARSEITAQYQEQFQEVQRVRAEQEQERARLQRQQEEAQAVRQQQMEREVALEKQEAMAQQSSAQKQAQGGVAQERRSLTPTGQLQSTMQNNQAHHASSSIPSEKQTRSAAMVTPPQIHKNLNEASAASATLSVDQSQKQKELQLKQEKLQQLIQLQRQQEEYIKLQQALEQQKQPQPNQKMQHQQNTAPLTSKGYIQIDDVDQQPTPKTPQTIGAASGDLLIQRGEGQKQSQALSQQTDNVGGGLADRMNVVGTPQQPRGKSTSFMNSVDYNDDDQDNDQEQDQDLMMYNSGSKNKMHNVKEESSYLPDCVVPAEKIEKKKVVKKVRFHDDEQLIDSPVKSSSRYTPNNNHASQSSSGNALATGATSLAGHGNSGPGVGKKRLRQEVADANGEHIILSQDLSASIGPDGSSQLLDRYEDEEEMEQRESRSFMKFQDQTKEQMTATSKRQRTSDDPTGREAGSGDHTKLDDEGGELQNVRQSGPRLRKKVFQEDTNASVSGDDVEGRQQRKKRKAATRAPAGMSSRSTSPAPEQHKQNAGPQHAPAHQLGHVAQQRNIGKVRASHGGPQAGQSNTLEQKVKQHVASSLDQQYLKKNPNLLSMIQRIARK